MTQGILETQAGKPKRHSTLFHLKKHLTTIMHKRTTAFFLFAATFILITLQFARQTGNERTKTSKEELFGDTEEDWLCKSNDEENFGTDFYISYSTHDNKFLIFKRNSETDKCVFQASIIWKMGETEEYADVREYADTHSTEYAYHVATGKAYYLKVDEDSYDPASFVGEMEGLKAFQSGRYLSFSDSTHHTLIRGSEKLEILPNGTCNIDFDGWRVHASANRIRHLSERQLREQHRAWLKQKGHTCYKRKETYAGTTAEGSTVSYECRIEYPFAADRTGRDIRMWIAELMSTHLTLNAPRPTFRDERVAPFSSVFNDCMKANYATFRDSIHKTEVIDPMEITKRLAVRLVMNDTRFATYHVIAENVTDMPFNSDYSYYRTYDKQRHRFVGANDLVRPSRRKEIIRLLKTDWLHQIEKDQDYQAADMKFLPFEPLPHDKWSGISDSHINSGRDEVALQFMAVLPQGIVTTVHDLQLGSRVYRNDIHMFVPYTQLRHSLTFPLPKKRKEVVPLSCFFKD